MLMPAKAVEPTTINSVELEKMNFTKVPNLFLDLIFPLLDPIETAVIMLTLRETLGRHRITAPISNEEFAMFAKASTSATIEAKSRVIGSGLLIQEKKGGGLRRSVYGLNPWNFLRRKDTDAKIIEMYKHLDAARRQSQASESDEEPRQNAERLSQDQPLIDTKRSLDADQTPAHSSNAEPLQKPTTSDTGKSYTTGALSPMAPTQDADVAVYMPAASVETPGKVLKEDTNQIAVEMSNDALASPSQNIDGGGEKTGSNSQRNLNAATADPHASETPSQKPSDENEAENPIESSCPHDGHSLEDLLDTSSCEIKTNKESVDFDTPTTEEKKAAFDSVCFTLRSFGVRIGAGDFAFIGWCIKTYTVEYVRQKIELMKMQKSRGIPILNPLAWLRTALAKNWSGSVFDLAVQKGRLKAQKADEMAEADRKQRLEWEKESEVAHDPEAMKRINAICAAFLNPFGQDSQADAVE